MTKYNWRKQKESAIVAAPVPLVYCGVGIEEPFQYTVSQERVITARDMRYFYPLEYPPINTPSVSINGIELISDT
jgi:hypothetical protein